MNTRTALGVAGIVAVAVTLGIVAGLSLSGGPADGDPEATPAMTGTPDRTPTPVLTMTSPTTTPVPTPTPTETPEPAISASSVEYLIYQRVNYLRTSEGHERLPLNESLRTVARYHSEGMAREGKVYREGPDGETLADRLTRFDVDCESSTETVGRLVAGTPVQDDDGKTVTYETPEEVAHAIVRKWVDWSGLRNVVSELKWTDVAVGVHTVERDDGTVVYATQVFCDMESA
jgi:uncharacterized protein YkwD